jgi:hypothetical protein
MAMIAWSTEGLHVCGVLPTGAMFETDCDYEEILSEFLKARPLTAVHAGNARPHISRVSNGNDAQPRDCGFLLIADLDRPVQMASWRTLIDLMHGTPASIFTPLGNHEI